MIKKVKKGKHRFTPISFGLFYDKPYLRRTVSFEGSCWYNISSNTSPGALNPSSPDYDPDDPQLDINKLFGIGYIAGGGHMQDSARFGWRYDVFSGRILLFAFCHINGQMFYKDLCLINFCKKYILSIEIDDKGYDFVVVNYKEPNSIIAEYRVAHNHDKKWAYLLGPYFGGNLPAPHDMELHLDKV